jgi:peptidoglycan/xylan/chitin deacetylase (PgdA/CDA1 family)
MRHLKFQSLYVINTMVLLLIPVLSGFFPPSASSTVVFGQAEDEDIESNDFESDSDRDSDSNNKAKYVILTFDGGHKSQYTIAKPVLDKYGFKATFHVVCDYTQEGGDTRMNWTETKELYKQGHDIGSNTVNHYVLTQLPTGKMEHEVSASKQCLLDQGINATSLAYPYNRGSTTSAVVNTVAKYYQFARSAGYPLMFLDCNLQENEEVEDSEDNETATTILPNDCRPHSKGQDESSIKIVHRYSVRGWSHEEERKEHKYDDSQMLQRFIEVVNSQSKYNQNGTINAIPILIYQKIESDTNDSSLSAATNIDLFDAEMKYLHDNGFIVITMADLLYDENTAVLRIKENKSLPTISNADSDE